MSESETVRIGPYRVIEVIGRGGFATVYRCVDDRLEASVAIKVLADNHSADANIRGRFLAEGRLLRKIDNQHLIRIYDAGETDRGQPYLVLELADRGDLRTRVTELVDRDWQPSLDDVKLLANVLVDAVSALHQNGLVHRDLSPNNVLIRSTSRTQDDPLVTLIEPDERLVVADLGFAKDIALHSGLTVRGGTPHFSAPEQFAVGQVDSRADLFAMARVIQWFIGSAESEASWPRDLEESLTPFLAEDPTERPATANDFAAALNGVFESHAELQRPQLAHGRPAHGQPAHGRARLQARAMVLAALLTIGLGVGAVVMRGGSSVQDLGNGVGMVAEESGSSVLRIRGPAAIPVSETGVYMAELENVSGAVWTLPDGTEIEGSQSVAIDTFGPGRANLKLTAVAADNEDIQVVFPIEVTAD